MVTESRPILASQPVWDLQMMLDAISRAYPAIPAVIPDGIFGERTLEAVMTFQREFFPPVTGVVDSRVWNAIVEKYREVLERYGLPEPLRVFPNGWFVIQEGDSPEQMWLIQTMFNSIAKQLSNFRTISPDGIHGGVTADNTRALQQMAGLPVTGAIDRPTWGQLARLYSSFVTRPSAQQPQSLYR